MANYLSKPDEHTPKEEVRVRSDSTVVGAGRPNAGGGGGTF